MQQVVPTEVQEEDDADLRTEASTAQSDHSGDRAAGHDGGSAGPSPGPRTTEQQATITTLHEVGASLVEVDTVGETADGALRGGQCTSEEDRWRRVGGGGETEEEEESNPSATPGWVANVRRACFVVKRKKLKALASNTSMD